MGTVIGRGAFGSVYRGEWRGRQCAVKTLAEELRAVAGAAAAAAMAPAQPHHAHHQGTPSPQDEAALAAADFIAEARLHASLEHDNVLRVLALVTAPAPASPPTLHPRPPAPSGPDDVVAILTELCPEGSLWDQLHRPPSAAAAGSALPAGPLSTTLAATLGADVARGLAYLHAFRPPLLHRDLKSPNLLCQRERGRLKLLLADFGLARVKARLAGVATMTAGLGTLQWTAPEVLQSDRYSEAADIYSAGVVLWELVNRGRVPWAGMAPAAVALAVCGGKRLPLSGTHPDMEAIIARCWHHDPSKRPVAAELLAELVALAGGPPVL